MYSVFLSSYRNTRESLGELEKAVETLACGSCSHYIFRSPKLPLEFLKLDGNTVHAFSSYYLMPDHTEALIYGGKLLDVYCQFGKKKKEEEANIRIALANIYQQHLDI